MTNMFRYFYLSKIIKNWRKLFLLGQQLKTKCLKCLKNLNNNFNDWFSAKILKNKKNILFFLRNSNLFCNFSAVFSPCRGRMGSFGHNNPSKAEVVFLSWAGENSWVKDGHIEGVLRALFWLTRISQILKFLSKTSRHKMLIGMYYMVRTRMRTCVHIVCEHWTI